MVKEYVPDRGDIIWTDFDPALGHEQKGRRPAFVVSPRSYNSATGLLLVCPITSHSKGYPFDVPCRIAQTDGVILTNQIRCLDRKIRRVKHMATAPPEVVKNVERHLLALIRS